MSTLEHAIEIAAKAHTGQVDKAGQPYFLHPLRVMLMLDSDHERMTAVLHDVVEDTSLTIEDLSAEMFPEDVIEAVRVLTRQKGESRIEAAKLAVGNPIARAVKIADVKDNLNIDRISNPTEEDFARLKEYEIMLEILLEGKGT